MREYLMFLFVALAIATPVRAASDDKPSGEGRPQIEMDASTLKVLEIINSASAYEVPDLELRKDDNYAYTSQEVEPFRHVRPFKEHFLLQMEYTGPGRAKPEPEHVDTVKLGFIGPIMSTVSVATGGKSHEEPMGIKMLQGARLAIEEANSKGGYLKRNIPFELLISNDNGLWGRSGNGLKGVGIIRASNRYGRFGVREIRDVLAYRMTPWKGVSWDIVFSACLDDLGTVFLAKREKGAWKYYSRQELDVPQGHVPARDRVHRSS